MIYDKTFYDGLKKCMDWQITIGERIVDHYGFRSVIDFGCGNGYYLYGAFARGALVKGYEYSYEQCKSYINELIRDRVSFADLSLPIATDKKYDMAMSFEVAEHLPENKADTFICNLVSASDFIIFSAASVGQGGTDHINEQPQSYWISKFNQKGYSYSDDDSNILKSMFGNLIQKKMDELGIVSPRFTYRQKKEKK